jgi:ribonuclease BN (tRNA processing enzyme)
VTASGAARLVILGSGSAGNLDRHPTALAFTTAESGTLLVDAGGGTEFLRQLSRAHVDIAAIEHVYVTHTDFDHCGGLVPLLFAYALGGDEGPLTVLGSAPVVERLREVTRLLAANLDELAGDRIRWRALELEQRCELGPGRAILPFAAVHQTPELGPTGLVVELAGTRVCYSGDTQPHAALARHARDVHLLVHEASHHDGQAGLGERTGHSTPAQAAELAREANVGALVLVHLDVPPEDAAERTLVEAARGTFAPLVVARDLMELELAGGAILTPR